eukprot:3931456-Prymnesium_polylepis.1
MVRVCLWCECAYGASVWRRFHDKHLLAVHALSDDHVAWHVDGGAHRECERLQHGDGCLGEEGHSAQHVLGRASVGGRSVGSSRIVEG